MRVRPPLPRRHTLTSMAAGDFPGAMAPDRQHRIDVGGLASGRPRVGRRGSVAAVPGAWRLRLQPHLRGVRPQVGRRRVARRRLGSARPRRQRPRPAVRLGRRHPRRDGGDGRRHPGPGAGDRPLQGRIADDPAGRCPAVPVQPSGQPRRAAVDSAASPTSPSTSARRWWPARSPDGSITGGAPPTWPASRARSRSWPGAGSDEPPPVRSSGSATSSRSAPGRTPTAGGGRSTPRCASAGSGRGDRSGRSHGCRAWACRSSAPRPRSSRRWAGARCRTT